MPHADRKTRLAYSREYASRNPAKIAGYRKQARADGRTAAHARKTRAARRTVVNGLKTKPCMDCGQQYPPYVMDFDHRPGESKHFEIGANIGKSLQSVLAEAAKCDVVCANCHRERTHKRKVSSLSY